MQEAVNALKNGMENHVQQTPTIATAEIGPLLGALERTSDITSQVAASRLENCRTIRLPRNEEKSFLAAQYNPSMQAAVIGRDIWVDGCVLGIEKAPRLWLPFGEGKKSLKDGPDPLLARRIGR